MAWEVADVLKDTGGISRSLYTKAAPRQHPREHGGTDTVTRIRDVWNFSSRNSLRDGDIAGLNHTPGTAVLFKCKICDGDLAPGLQDRLDLG